MDENTRFNNPWLVAVWPGMGQVAIAAGYHLMMKLGAYSLAEFSPPGLFDIEHVGIKNGLIQKIQLPRNRLFAWHDPAGKRDLIIFIGEAQPPLGKLAFCQSLIENTRELGIQRVFTFAAMATSMRPEDNSRVFAAATDGEILRDLQPFDLDLVEEGYIGGLNGVLMGVAADNGLHGACLLGEIPRVFAQLPSPKGALAVLRAFSSLAEIDIDLRELSAQAEAMDHQLSDLLEQVEHALEEQEGSETESEEFRPGSLEEDTLEPQDKQRIEQLFAETQLDRSRAFELKAELDRLNVFRDYEDRFLDLFKKPQ